MTTKLVRSQIFPPTATLSFARRAFLFIGFWLAMVCAARAAVLTYNGGVLTIALDAANEAVTLSNDGTIITVGSNADITGEVDGPTFFTAFVTAIVVNDPGNLAGQSLTFVVGTAFSLSGGLDVTGVEAVIFYNSVTATGSSSILVDAPQNILVRGSMLTGGSGGIQLIGQGTAAASTVGVELSSGAVVTATGMGSVRVEGKGGSSTGSDNHGINVFGINSKITSSGGDVEVKGTGGGSGSSDNNYGVYVNTGSEITAGSMGSVTVEGQGGNTTGTGGFNRGIFVIGTNAKITSSGGEVEVKGMGGGSGSSTNNAGVSVWIGGEITAGGMGSVSVEGQGGNDTNTGGSNSGIIIIGTNTRITSSGGDVEVKGTGGSNGSSDFNCGVCVTNSGEITAGGMGSVNVEGQGGNTTGNFNYGVFVHDPDSKITSSSGAIEVKGTGSGSAADILTESGGMITSTSPTSGITLRSTTNGTWPNTAGTDVSTTATQSTTFGTGSKLNIIIDGLTANTEYQQLSVVGRIDLNGAALTFEGSTFMPSIGNTFNIVDNDGMDAIIGTFQSLPEGGTITDFLGSGLVATISYTGGDGNDVVLTVVPSITISGHIVWEHDLFTPVPDATVSTTGDDTGSGDTNTAGNYEIPTAGGDLTVTPTKQDYPRQGVDAADVTRIRQHVLATVPFTDPYKRIAADVNQSNSVTNADAAIIQQALLLNTAAGNILDDPAWRFVDAAHTFTTPAMPWNFPDTVSLTGVNSDVTGVDFIGVKIGDVNGSWAAPAPLVAAPLTWQVADQWLEAGRTMRVPFTVQASMADVAAWQFALRFDPAQVAFGQVIPRTAVPLTREEFGVSRALDGELRSVLAVAEGVAVKAGEVAFELELHVRRGGVRLSEVLRLDDEALEGRVYDTALRGGPVALAFRPMANTPYVPGIQPTADTTFELYQNEPNPTPADAATAIRFHLPEAGRATLTVQDALGRVVHQQKGAYAEGQNVLLLDAGRLSAKAGGVFTYTLRFEGGSGATYAASRRMVVVR